MGFWKKFCEMALNESEQVIDLLCDYDELNAVRVFEACWINDEFDCAGVMEILEHCEDFNCFKDEYYYMDDDRNAHGLETWESVKDFNRKQVEDMNQRELLNAIIKADYSNYLSGDFTKLLDDYTGNRRGLDITTLSNGEMFVCDNVVYRIVGGKSCQKQALSLEPLELYPLYRFRNKYCYKVD